MKYEYLKTDSAIPMKNWASLGMRGWELVTVDNGTAYFKRPLTLLDKLQSK